MAGAVDTDVSIGRTYYVTKGTTANITASMGRPFTIYNVPAQNLVSSSAMVKHIISVPGPIDVSSARVLAVFRGRIDNFSMRSYTVTVDGHDWYVLNLGESGTLVYDTLTSEWMSWDGQNTDIPNFRGEFGLNWNAVSNNQYDSDVIIGDNLTGMLYYFDPTQPYDGDAYDPTVPTVNRFTRVLTGGVPARGRGTIDCNFVFLTASFGMPLLGSQITLKTSDDLGKTWTDNGAITIDAMEWDQDVTWSSLGSFGTPGRIFQICDDGAFERIDSLDMQ